MNYFDISDNGRRLKKREFENARKLDSDKNEYCGLWHYKDKNMQLLGRFTLPVNLISIANKLQDLEHSQQLKVFEDGYFILSDTETLQIEPE